MFTLKPVGHQSTNCMVLLVLMEAIAALTSLGTTSPLYSMQHAMYLPCRGSHFTICVRNFIYVYIVMKTAADVSFWAVTFVADPTIIEKWEVYFPCSQYGFIKNEGSKYGMISISIEIWNFCCEIIFQWICSLEWIMKWKCQYRIRAELFCLNNLN